MKLLHNVGEYNHSNYNTREEILNCHDQLSLDGIYENVWYNRDLLLNRKQPNILFVMWGYIGGDNYFDVAAAGVPFEKYCSLIQLSDLLRGYNCLLASHSWSHRDLTQLSDDEIRKELVMPFPVRGPKYFAYPYGRFNDRVIELVIEAGYDDAWSVDQGNGGLYQRNRSYL